jgi:uncharacterized membrane protein YccC
MLRVHAVPLSKNAADTDRVRARRFRNACDGSVKGGSMNTDTLSDQPVSPYVVHGVAGLRVAVAGITVLALLLFDVAAPGEETITITIGSRLADTVIGAVLALVLRQLLWPGATLRRLPGAQALTLRATSRVLAEAWAQRPDPQVLADRRRALQEALAVLRAVDADAAADTGLVSRSTDAAWPVSAGIEELARLALSWPAYRPRPEPAQATALRHHLEELASAILLT